jgi:hypothetical protein
VGDRDSGRGWETNGRRKRLFFDELLHSITTGSMKLNLYFWWWCRYFLLSHPKVNLIESQLSSFRTCKGHTYTRRRRQQQQIFSHFRELRFKGKIRQIKIELICKAPFSVVAHTHWFPIKPMPVYCY